MKVLIFAYACEPSRGSEPGLGWHISSEIARRNAVTLVVRKNNQEKIESYLREHPECPHKATYFIYFDCKCWIGRFKKLIPFGTQLYFSCWLRAALKQIGSRISEYDIVHQLTFAPFFIRPWGAFLTDNYVWGPVGGGGGPYARFGRHFLKREPMRVRFNELIYQFLYWYINQSWFGGRFRDYRRRAKAVLFKSTAFSAGYEPSDGQVVRITRETGFDGEPRRRFYELSPHPLRLICVGNLIPSKAFKYAILAFAKYIESGGDGVLSILGTGWMRSGLEKLARDCGVEEKVHFLGQVPNPKVHEMLDESDVFFFPSFSEATSWALIEAMAHGLPIVCHNRSGMMDVVVPSCGTMVTTDDPDELVDLYATALLSYYQNPELIKLHGQGAVERVKTHYAWDAIGKQFDEVYIQIQSKVKK